MAIKKMRIRGKEYVKPSMDSLKRGQARRLGEIMKPLANLDGGLDSVEALDTMWDLVGVMVPELSEETLDDLSVGECKRILEDAGMFAADPGSGISAGE